MSERLPSEIKVTTEVRPTLYQADCDQCGWHTRQAEQEWWVRRMAEKHLLHCPEPFYENGASMECGCWYRAMPGDVAGTSKETCPIHGPTLMVAANVRCPNPWVRDWWVAAPAVEVSRG